MGGEGRERREGEKREGEGRVDEGREGRDEGEGRRDRYNIALCLTTHTEGKTFTLIATSQDNITIRTWSALYVRTCFITSQGIRGH